MANNLGAVAQLLEASLDPRQNKQAELALRQEEKKPGFSLFLLQITASADFPYNTRLASALCFKNLIRRSWVDEDGNHKLPQDEVVTIKRELINLMINVPGGIQTQLGEAVSVIADSDFWERWDTLVADLVSRLDPKHPVVNNGVLTVAHSIFRRWRPLFRSDDLFTEINHVLSTFSAPYLALFEGLDAYIEENKSNKETLSQGFKQLDLMIKLLYDLNCQDLAPLVEDNAQSIANLLLKYLLYDNPLLHTDDESEAGVLEFVKAGIFEVLTLFVQKYSDVFEPHVGHMPEHAKIFEDQGTLSQVIEKVILPNIALRESDEELFEDEPIEFIRRDLEGSDSDTRRRAATDFVRQLATKFEDSVTRVVSQYTDHYLAEYAKDPASNWKSKDTATYLFSAIAAKGAATASHGITTVSKLVDIADFFQKHLAADLVSDGGVNPILKVDAIKYLYLFRSIITPQQWQEVFPLLVKHLGSDNYVVYTYAAIAVERVLAFHDSAGQPVISPANITPLAKELLEHLFQLVEKDPSPPKVQENEFLMKCVMRVLIVIKEGVVPLTDAVLEHLIKITRIISANPSNPRFYYYHFESIGAFIRFAAPANPEKLEQALYAPFAEVLQADVQEFMPYVFQLFAALLEANSSATLSEYYQNLIAPILMPVMWESKGNIPALVRLLSAIIPRGAQFISQNNQVEPILGLFQKLLSTKANESHGFDLLESVIGNFPANALEQYFVSIMQIILTRLQNSKTEVLQLRFVRFYHFVSARDDQGYSADFFIQVTDKVQAQLFTPLYLNVILPESQKLARPLDRKTAVISFTKTLANSEAFAQQYKKGWGFTCEALLKLLELPPVPVTRDDIIMEHDVDDMAFGVGFTQLNTVRPRPKDPWPETGADLKVWTGKYLTEANSKQGGRIHGFVQERLNPELQKILASYMTA
ncbi:Cse1 homolog [Talaromyces pinophilus]|uniref:Cse1 homolog n=1 Tax=Talaromyces pinophilus TaxID=128442 RepID=A0A6V8HFZ3_TALPI|nr:Cse1 homolog [Talaromyces pinophilus]